MSLTRHTLERSLNLFGHSAVGHRCFFCREFLYDLAVIWNGNDGQRIYLHGPCVETWMPAILRDALELRYSQKPCWNQLVAKT